MGVHPAFTAAAPGHASFEWLIEDGLLLWHIDWERPGPPSGIAVIGRDDTVDSCSMLYSDERGVSRIYQVSLEGGVWRMWRDSAGFCQRMTASFSEDGNTITSHGELSRDGSTWQQDLHVTYTRE